MRNHHGLLLTLFCSGIFLGAVHFAPPQATAARFSPPAARVVIAAPLQVLMFAGDRYLAANLETIRIAATGLDTPLDQRNLAASYLVRAHNGVAQLNACQEDNYYLGNALLSWSGAEDEGLEVLRQAMECRYWDELPAFLYGFNSYFFHHDASEAQRALEIAAQRSSDNAAALRKLAIMIAAGEFNDLSMAIDYLKHQRDQATDMKLQQMLDKRVGRLEGLSRLRQAQKQYERKFGRPLTAPVELIQKGLLQQFPTDPLGLGYDFRNGEFHLHKLEIEGMEMQR
jgi:hypothetical protein